MAITNPYKAYQENSVTTATPGELTLMLYNGCLKFINQAKYAISVKDIETKHINITKAQNIVNELIVTLNMNVPVSKDMRRLYDFINRTLIEANIKNDVKKLDEAAGLVTEFRDTWKQAIQLNRQKQYTSNGSV